MRPVVAFPDAESVVTEYLAPLLAAYDNAIPIGVRGGGGRFVRVRRVGGAEDSIVLDHPTIDVIVWHDSDRERMRLAQYLWAVLRAADDVVIGARLTYRDTVLGPRQMPDPADDTKACCLFTVTVLTRQA